MSRPWRAWAQSLVMAAAICACAPSPRIVYQGNANFEYCYAADQNPDVTSTDRELCWTAWLAHYTRHQSADHVDYALRRIEALQYGEEAISIVPEVETAPKVEDDVAQHSAVGAEADPIRSQNSLQGYATQGDNSAKPGCKVTCQQLSVACVYACQKGFDPCLQTCEAEQRICLGGCY